MPVFIARKIDMVGTIQIPRLEEEITLFEVGGFEDDFIVEAWLDLSELKEGDVLDLLEYVAMDGINYKLYMHRRYFGPLAEPIIRIHTKTYYKDMKMKISIIQTKGTPRKIDYVFIAEILATI